MPRTPPLLLPSSSTFQFATHETPQPMLPPQEMLSLRSHQLSSVVEEKDGMNEDEDSALYSYASTHQARSPKQHQRERTLTDPGNYQHKRSLTMNDDDTHSVGSTQSLPGKRPREEDAHPPSKDTIYQELMDRHGYIKDKLDTEFTELRQVEAHTQEMMQELSSYNKNLAARCNAVRQRWIQIQSHSRDLLAVSKPHTQ